MIKITNEVTNGELENRVSKLNKAIHMIHNKKENMKDFIEKQKTTIDCLKNKSPVQATETDNNAATEAI